MLDVKCVLFRWSARRERSADDIVAKIERLAELRKDVLPEEDYASKKAELLARL